MEQGEGGISRQSEMPVLGILSSDPVKISAQTRYEVSSPNSRAQARAHGGFYWRERSWRDKVDDREWRSRECWVRL